MTHFFTSFKESATETTDFISRLLTASLKIRETRAILGTGIRDTEFQDVTRTN